MGGDRMFGIPDLTIVAVYLLCISSALLCAIYGLVNWNKGGELESQQIEEEAEWELGEH